MTNEKKPTILTFVIVGIIVLLAIIINYPLESFLAFLVVGLIVTACMKWSIRK